MIVPTGGLPQDQALSVSAALELVERPLIAANNQKIVICGELHDWRAWSSIAFFNLSDGKTRVCVFAPPDVVRALTATPAEGLEVIVEGRWEIYRPRGKLQIRASAVFLLDRDGVRRAAFQRLRRVLADEGLLDVRRKQALPESRSRIGVVAAPGSAALADIMAVVGRRAPWTELLVAPCTVQGQRAEREVPRALARLSALQPRPDLIILSRGGGASEDLQVFNTEPVARAIAKTPVPVITAIGHETDDTLADLVADVVASTPSAAAELATPDRISLQAELNELEVELRTAAERAASRVVTNFGKIAVLLHHVVDQRAAHEQLALRTLRTHDLTGTVIRRLENERRACFHAGALIGRGAAAHAATYAQLQGSLNTRTLRNSLESGLGRYITETELLRAQLGALSPFAPVGRGFLLVLHNDKALQSVATPQPGSLLRVVLPDGYLVARVESIHSKGG